MGHRAGSPEKFLLFSAFYWSKTSPTVFGTWHLISKHSQYLARGLLLVFDFEHHKHSGFWEGCWMERHSLLPPRNWRLEILAKAVPTRGCPVASDTTRSELTACSFTREDCGSLSELAGEMPYPRLYSYGDWAARLYSNQVFQEVQKSHQILFSLIPPASCAYIFYFKYNLAVKSRRKTYCCQRNEHWESYQSVVPE